MTDDELKLAAKILGARGGQARNAKKGFGSMTPERRSEIGKYAAKRKKEIRKNGNA